MNKFTSKMAAVVFTATLWTAGSAFAEEFYVDSGTDFGGSGSATDDFTSMTDHYWSATTITDADNSGGYSAGDTVSGTGGLLNTVSSAAATADGGSDDITQNLITGFVPSLGYDNDYGTSWVLSFGWDDLTGTVNAFGGIDYSSGTITVYYGDTNIAALTSLDENNMIAVMELEVTSGGGNAIGQSLNINGIVTEVFVDYFFWASDDTPFEGMLVSFLTNQNTEPYYLNGVKTSGPIALGTDIYGADGTALLEGEHDGSISFNRVPEPATLALLGVGLLCLLAFRSNRKPRSLLNA